ncbi:MAG: thiamine pyrophosphate-binding protein [Planctomycetes bacterium]|nr:thiamine pyrophosphate-binding protein [Planctomycetota bacterium]
MPGQPEFHGGLLIAETLARHGARFLFTLCGGHISPVVVACRQRGLRVIDVRDEATAVFAADAVARLTGAPGVAAVTAGPGLTNTITAVKNAQLAQSPVVILGGATATILKGRGALQDIDQMALMRPHVKSAETVRAVRGIIPALERAFNLAPAGVPGPVFVELPVDLLYPEKLVREWYGLASEKAPKSFGGKLFNRYLQWHLRRIFAPGPNVPPAGAPEIAIPRPEPAEVDRAAALLKQARRPVLLAGSQALLAPHEAAELRQAVLALGIPTYLSGMARGLLGREPLQARHQRKLALKEADLVVLAGVPCDFRLDYGRHIPLSAELISVNRSSCDLRKNRRPDLGIRADPGAFLVALAASLRGPHLEWGAWQEILRRRDAARDGEIETEAQRETEYINPVRLCQEIEKAIGEDSIIVGDGGDFVATASYIVRPRSPLSWLDPGPFGTLGVGAGFALGARLCRPRSEVWILYGDGAAAYSLAEFDTFSRHGLPVIAVVATDAAWTQIAREQVEIFKDDVATQLARTPYHLVAQGYGAEGLLIQRHEEIAPGLERARELARSGRPVLVNAFLGRTGFRKGSVSL